MPASLTALVTALGVAVLCGVAATALTRWMRALAEAPGAGGAVDSSAAADADAADAGDVDSRWLHSGLHVLLAVAGGAGAAVLASDWAEQVTFAVLAVACALLVTIDLAVYRLPDKIVLPLYPLVLAGLAAAAAVSEDWGSLGRAMLAGLALLASYFVLALINPSGLGLGDVKLSGVLGLFLGWLGWPAVMAGTLAAFVINAAVALVLLAARRVGAKSGIAFGPAMVVGAAVGAGWWAWRTSVGS